MIIGKNLRLRTESLSDDDQIINFINKGTNLSIINETSIENSKGFLSARSVQSNLTSSLEIQKHLETIEKNESK